MHIHFIKTLEQKGCISIEQHKLDQYKIDLNKYRIDTAIDDLKTAHYLVEGNNFRSANNRAYYAIFHAITAVQALDGKTYKKHKDAIGNFNKDYIHTGIFPKEYGRKISEAEDIRHESDYDDFYIASKEETMDLISIAEELTTLIKDYSNSRIKNATLD